MINMYFFSDYRKKSGIKFKIPHFNTARTSQRHEMSKYDYFFETFPFRKAILDCPTAKKA